MAAFLNTAGGGNFRELLEDIGTKGFGDVTVAGENVLFKAVATFRTRDAKGAYPTALLNVWDSDAEKIEALIGTIKTRIRDGAALVAARATMGLSIVQIQDASLGLLTLCELPPDLIADESKVKAGGLDRPPLIAPDLARRLIPALLELHKEGIPARIISGYRTAAFQAGLKASNANAADGDNSNHRRGLAVDLDAYGLRTDPIVKKIMGKYDLAALVAGATEDNHWSLTGH